LASKLKVDEWCYDNQATTNNGIDYYGAFTRLYTNKVPSLNCTGIKLTKFRDDTDMYVGTLTADEVVIAGTDAKYSSNNNFYLMNSFAQGKLFWWLLSPSSYSKDYKYDNAFYIYYNGNLFGNLISVANHSRPAVTLKADTIATTNKDTATFGQPGNINNPYVIK
jgi:hypothetical protein